MKRGYAETSEGQVHYLQDGAGEPLLLLHQTPRSAGMYLKLMPRLTDEYQVTAIDMLGYGYSDPPPIKNGVTEATDMARNIIHVLDALGIERSHLFGVHTGAFMASMTAIEAPERIGALILAGYGLHEGESDVEAFFSARERFGRKSAFTITHDGSHLQRIWMRAYSAVQRRWFHTRNPPSDPDAPELLREPSQHRSVHYFLTDEELEFMERWTFDFLRAKYTVPIYQSMINTNRTELLPRIKSPTLVIDPDSPYETPFNRRGAKVVALIPNAELTTLTGSDDNMAEFKAAELASAMLTFLRKHPL